MDGLSGITSNQYNANRASINAKAARVYANSGLRLANAEKNEWLEGFKHGLVSGMLPTGNSPRNKGIKAAQSLTPVRLTAATPGPSRKQKKSRKASRKASRKNRK